MYNFLKKIPLYAKIMIVSGIFGMIAFMIIYGVKILNPAYDEWLFTGGDMTQHYIGWLFYRQSEWHWPIGITDGLLGDISFSCMYTDSIPIFAVFFKLLSPILPETFQYFGLWGMFCFIMNGATSSLLIYKFNKNPVFCTLGSLIFTLCPAVLHRLYGHEALSAHFIIISAMLLWVYQNHRWSKKWMRLWMPAILWWCLGTVAVFTHMYFVPMIYCFLLASLIMDIFKYKQYFRAVSTFSFATMASLISLLVLGAFYNESSQTAYGLGLTSANLNTFWNGMTVGANGIFAGIKADGSTLFGDIPCEYWQFEGFAYLGAGVLLAVLLSVIIVLTYLIRGKKPFITAVKQTLTRYKWHIITTFVVFFIALFFAVSPKCMFNETMLYEIEYPQKIREILEIFRASGRFAWVCDYLIFTAVLFILSKIKIKKVSVCALALCLCIQIIDLGELIRSKEWFKEEKNVDTVLVDERWEELAAGALHLVVLPYEVQGSLNYDLARFAYNHDMTISHFSVARPPFDSIVKMYHDNIAKLAQGNADPLSLYVFLDKQYIPENVPDVEVYEIDGFTVLKCK